jgi:thiol-disulfide isomerase/thioredoxin
MNLKIKSKFLFSFTFVLIFSKIYSQKIEVYKIDPLLNRIQNKSDTTYIVNFWATWCKPCVAELPDFEKIDSIYKTEKIKVLLVSLDFKEDLNSKLKPFIDKHKFKSECIILDEANGNDFINKISESWSGAIPATLITNQNKQIKEFYEKKISFNFLTERLNANKLIHNP